MDNFVVSGILGFISGAIFVYIKRKLLLNKKKKQIKFHNKIVTIEHLMDNLSKYPKDTTIVMKLPGDDFNYPIDISYYDASSIGGFSFDERVEISIYKGRTK